MDPVNQLVALPAAPSRWNLVGKTALVTGATRGIGWAIAEELAVLGASVYVCARSGKEVEERVAEWRRRGLPVAGSACDVSSLDRCHQLVAAVAEHFAGKLDILVNNAGTLLGLPTIDEATPDFLRLVMSTNFESGLHISRLTYPLLRQSGNASIVFISSIASFFPNLPSYTLYSASKGAMNQITKGLACEWGRDNIRVNAIAPGYTHSHYVDKIAAVEIPNLATNVSSRTPLGRLGEAQEIAANVAFLCMPGSSFTTGTIIVVDGGFTCHCFDRPF